VRLLFRQERSLTPLKNSSSCAQRVCENMVLRRIFGPRKEEVTAEWRRLHNEELNDL